MAKPFVKRWLYVVFSLVMIFAVIILIMKRDEYYPEAGRRNSVHSNNFKWLDVDNATRLKHCRNSVQGRNLIADEKGYICSHGDIGVNGCCKPEKNSSERFCCSTCQKNRCCKFYEHCVSCCLQPNKQHLLEKVLAIEQDSKTPLLRSATDTFELCLSKCRTSSVSVLQENVYRDSIYKFCYGLDPPSLQNVK